MPEITKKEAIRSLLLNRGLNQQEIDNYTDDLGYAEGFVSDSLSGTFRWYSEQICLVFA